RLVEGLSGDFTRRAAEAALPRFGAAARPLLIRVAVTPLPCAEYETASSRATRRSAVGVLREIGVNRKEWSELRPLMDAGDPRLAALACVLALATRQMLPDREGAIWRLVRLLRSADWLLAIEIEGWLTENYDIASRVLADAAERSEAILQTEKVHQSLQRVAAAVTLDNTPRFRREHLDSS
ncbi:MAG TPA: hypothetical protein VHX12_11270, partial [Acidisoma sp.]|nr:hypothetical protein [Acidisoma sp.]